MQYGAPSRTRFFTPAQANRMLPLVRQIARDLVARHESVEMQRAQLEGIEKLRSHVGPAPYADEVQAVQRALQAERRQLEECWRELGVLGLRVHAAGIGAVDFPAYHADQPAVLCWRLGESTVGFWHEVDAPLECRRSVRGESFQSDRGDDPLRLPRDDFPPLARS